MIQPTNRLNLTPEPSAGSIGFFAIFLLTTLAAVIPLPAAQPVGPPVATYSIVALDPETGDLGVGVQSKFFGVGSVVPFAKAGVGAIATQSYANTQYGPQGLKMLQQGFSAEGAVHELTKADPNRGFRQLGIVDARGQAAAYTGRECNEWAGHIVGDFYAVQGNILAGEAVVKQMDRAFILARNNGGELADWIMAALAAAENAGGDKRGRQSAAMLVVREKGGYGGGNDRYIDLRVDDHPEPIVELSRLLELHKQFYSAQHRKKPTPASILADSRKQEPSDFERWGWPVFLAAFAGIGVIFVASSKNPEPPELGVENGLLKPCPENKINTVNSQTLESELRVSPLTMPSDLDEARRIIGEAVMRLPRTKLIAEANNYFRYECKSALFRFVDDLELFFNEDEKLVHIRSGARVGYWDLGVNRRRVEELRAMLPLEYQGPAVQASLKAVQTERVAKNEPITGNQT